MTAVIPNTGAALALGLPAVDADLDDVGVLTITLDRPAQLNAMTPTMEKSYLELLRRAEADRSVRAVVLTGRGRGFCAGADLGGLSELVATPSDALKAALPAVPEALADGPGYPLTFRKPLIAAINGACLGVGFAHALYCDVRFAADGAKIGTAFSRRGLVAEYGTAWLLPRLIGRANALDLLLSGRTVFADEALTLGLVQRVLPVTEMLPAAQAYARELANWSSPTSMAIIKEQVLLDEERDLARATADSLHRMYVSFTGSELVEGVSSHLERRPPQFPGWSSTAPH